MLTIRLNNLRFHGHIGVYPEEKKIGQDLGIDLVIHTTIDYQSIHDDLHQTLSYGDVYRLTAKVVTKSRADLIETLAQEVLETVKSQFLDKIDHLTVRIRKFNTPIDGILDNVEVEVSDQ